MGVGRGVGVIWRGLTGQQRTEEQALSGMKEANVRRGRRRKDGAGSHEMLQKATQKVNMGEQLRDGTDQLGDSSVGQKTSDPWN